MFVARFNNFLYIAIFNGMICLLILLAVSFATRPQPREQIDDLLWRPSVMRIRNPLPGRGTSSLVFWWILCMILTAGLYGYLAWFQFGR
jgi:hypothetical protein